jgi:DNA-binding IclR family transcriptional regulator
MARYIVRIMDSRAQPSLRVAGAQAVTRAIAVITAVSDTTDQGARTADVATRSRLPRPTAYRLLTALQEAGYVDRNETTGLWHLGPELYMLGVIAARRFEVTEDTRRAVARLAKETAETAFFSLRRGNEAFCVVREEGSFPLRSFVLREGSRFPFGVSSGGLVMLAYHSDEEIDRYLTTTDLTQHWGMQHSAERVHARIHETRESGFALNPGLIVEGSYGMAAAIFSASGQPEAALSITGVESRFRRQRQAELGSRLLELAHELSRPSPL